MKYSKENQPLVCMQTQSTCYKEAGDMNIKGILWHSTGANNPNLKRYVQPSDNAIDKSKMLKLLGTNTNKNDWNHIDVKKGVNAWIGKLEDGTVTTIQTMPWNHKPWGCGTGSIGSCNDGWIQFEICEDNLASEAYFNAIYAEACELTAYLCNLYGLDPKGTVDYMGRSIPVILCHADSHKLGFGSNHGDILHWTKKYGKTMDTIRDDVANILATISKKIEIIEDNKDDIQGLFTIKKSQFENSIGTFLSFNKAKKACDKAGKDYCVYDEALGIVMYPEDKVVYKKPETSSTAKKTIQIGDEVKLLPGAKYTSGKSIPSWVFKAKLYLREIRNSGNYAVSTQKTGALTGVVEPKFVVPYDFKIEDIKKEPTFVSYLVKIDSNKLNVRLEPNSTSKVVTQVTKGNIYTIIDEKDGWGKLKSGLGWISLSYTTPFEI